MENPNEVMCSAATTVVGEPSTDSPITRSNEIKVLVQSHGCVYGNDLPNLKTGYLNRSDFNKLRGQVGTNRNESMKAAPDCKETHYKDPTTSKRRASHQVGRASFIHPKSSVSIFDCYLGFMYFFDFRSNVRRRGLPAHHYSTSFASFLVIRLTLLCVCFVLIFSPWQRIPCISLLPAVVQAANSNYQSDYYNYYNNKNNGYYNYNKNYNYNYNNNRNSNGANDDASNDDASNSSANDDIDQSNDDTATADDASAKGDDVAGDNADDASVAASNANGAANNNGDDDFTDDYYGSDDDASAYNGDDNSYNKRNSYSNANGDGSNNNQSYQYSDDDVFHWNQNVGFDGVSIMPLSCINYNSGHMIKFQLYDMERSYQCHFAEISTFVVSISHFMRAYFNYEALTLGQDFRLPADAAYLNCLQLQETTPYGMRLYGKVGCRHRETFTSTKLQLYVYTDAQCSQHYDDGQTTRKHATRGYLIGDSVISTKVSFRPDFYSCLSCAPEQVAFTFNKNNSNWYDDDYIGTHGTSNKQSNDDDLQSADDIANNATDDAAVDDQYYSTNDDYQNYQGDDGSNDDGRNRILTALTVAKKEDLESYREEFWREYDQYMHQHDAQDLSNRSLYGKNYYSIGDWNMCQRVFKYGVWCDEECRALDFFRTNLWSASDIFLLVIMCLFMTAMMLLIIAKRLKAQQKARMYGDDHPIPGLPPFAMAIIFIVIMCVIITLAKVKFINETLVFAVVTCILLFIYMLKLTLFESRRPTLLAAPRHHDKFDRSRLDEHLFD